MLQKERTTATTANLGSVMESGNHSKNGASLKSLMSKGNWWIAACLFLFFSVMGACKDEKDNELPAPTGLTATQVEDGIKVSWNSVKGADCYMLQIADETGNSQQVDVYNCEHVFKPEKDGTYSFVVSARNSSNLGESSDAVYCDYTAPKKEEIEGDITGSWYCENDGVRITLNDDGTYTYKEKRYSEEEGTYILEGLELTLRDENGDLFRRYEVESITDASLIVLLWVGDYSTLRTFERLEKLTVPTGLKAVQVDGQKIQVSWNPVENADRYSLEYTYKYLSNSYGSQSEKLFNKVIDVQNNEYLYSPEYLTGVKSFSFSVRAIRDKSYEETAWSDTVSCDYMTPGGGTKSGLYMGIIGFNNTLNTKNISLLTDYKTDNANSFSSFINSMGMELNTGLYYAVDNAIQQLKIANLPQDLENVSIITFTDGLDNVSIDWSPDYDKEADYRAAVKRSIEDTKIQGLDINAYSIGVKGNDIEDVETFRKGISAMASADTNVYEVDNMEEVNETFNKIANSLYNISKKTTLQLKIPAGKDDSTVMRFVLDEGVTSENVSSAEFYVEGVYRRNGKVRTLENVVFHGVKSSCDTVSITGDYDEVKRIVTFKFENFEVKSTIPFDFQKITEWYGLSEGRWQKETEFGRKGDIESVEERSSAVILLVLDCTTSLGESDFQQMKNAATNFINILTNKN